MKAQPGPLGADTAELYRSHPVPRRAPLTTPTKIVASGISEADAIAGAKSGDGECFEFLYRLYKRRVYSLCLRMTGNISRAEDLTQDVFLQLYRKMVTLRGDSTSACWLHRLTFDIVLMHLRNRGLLKVSLDETLEPTEEIGAIKDFRSKDQILAGSERPLILERAIESLSPGRRIIFVLHDVEGYEHNQIAKMMGCSTGTSQSQLHKARMKLRGVLNITRANKRCHRQIETRRQVTMSTGRVASVAATASVQFLQCWR